MSTNFIVNTYLIYLPVALLLTFWVAHVLFKHSKVFMYDIFNHKEDIANATNKLFEIGFYLLNVGMALFILKTYGVEDTKGMIETLSSKLGGFSIYLGIMMFLNMFLFFRGKKVAARKRYERELKVGA